MMTLSEKILDLRKKAGLSQEELAEKLDVSRQAVSRWEVGSAMPDAANVAQLARLFGVTADYLLNDDYASDGDVPAVKRTDAAARMWIRRSVALCASAFGLFGNFFIYILSRFIEVPVPRVYYEDGKKWYEWAGYTGYSYRWFVEEHKLKIIVIACWLLLAAGLVYVLLNTEKVKSFLKKRRGIDLRRKK